MEEESDTDKPNRPNDFLRFYKSYFMDYWEVKYKFLKYEIENFETQKHRLAEIRDLNIIPNKEKKYLSILKFDLHFMKFQIIETLFSFIFALESRDDLNLWFNISFPKDSSERSFAVYDKISGLNDKDKMGNFLKNKIEIDGNLKPFWEYLFFFKIDLNVNGKEIDAIEENIITLLHQLASIFSDRDDYNAYKHSLRCYSSSLALSIRPEGTNQFIPLGYAKDGMNFLSKKEKDDNIIINSTFKAFSIEEDSYFINKSIELLKNIINSRISHFFSEKIGDICYFEEDIIQVLSLEDYTIPSISRSTISLNSLYLTGLYILKQGEFEKAIPFFEKVLQIKASHYETIFQLGYCHFSTGNYDKAIYYFKKYIKNSKAELWKYALFNLALCYSKTNDYSNAEKKLKQYFNKYSDVEDKLTNSARYLQADILLNLNQQYFNQKGKNKSNYIRRIEKLLKEAEEFEFRNPEIWFGLAFIKNCMNKFEESKIIYEKIIEKYPDYLDAILNLARICFNEGELEKVENLLEKALLINNTKSNTWNAIASLKEKQGKMEEFYEACQNSLKYSVNDEEKKYALYNLGTYYKITEDYNKAIEYYKKTLAIDGNFKLAFKGLMESLLKLEKYNEIIEKTKDLNYILDNVNLLRTRALAFSGIGKKEKAIELINELIPIDIKNGELQSFLNKTLGDIYKMQGEWEKAIEFYQKALSTIQGLHDKRLEINEEIEECKRKLNGS